MALTLTSGITADADEFVVTGAVPANVGPDFRFRIDDELLRLQGFGAHTEIVGAYARQWAGKDPQRWLVERGVEHSTPASHAQGADVLAANDVFASSDDLTPPSPFTESPGGSGLPAGGDIGDVVTNTAPGEGEWAAPTVGDSVLTSVTVNLTAEDIATLSSVPVEVVAAPGANKVIVSASAAFQFTAGDNPFALDAVLTIGFLTTTYLLGGTGPFASLDPFITAFQGVNGAFDPAAAENQPLVFLADVDPDLTGSILTSSVSEPGADFEVGDEFELTSISEIGTAAAGVVDTVDVGGEILTYHLTSAGSGFPVGETALSVITGIGQQAHFVVDSITPLSDGTARLTVLYWVMDLA